MIRIDEAPNFKFNSSTLMNRLMPVLIPAIETAADQYIKKMGQYAKEKTAIGKTGQGAPGAPEWRSDVGNDLKRMNLQRSVDGIEIEVGVYGDEALQKRVEVINTGSGNKAGGPAMKYGPAGRSVWNDDLSGRTVSETTRTGNMPDGFNNTGNQFAESHRRDGERERANYATRIATHIANIIGGRHSPMKGGETR